MLYVFGVGVLGFIMVLGLLTGEKPLIFWHSIAPETTGERNILSPTKIKSYIKICGLLGLSVHSTRYLPLFLVCGCFDYGKCVVLEIC